MGEPIDFSSWVAGWTSLAFVVSYGFYIFFRVRAHRSALAAVPVRILVTGSRGKSGTVRLLHQIVNASSRPAYAKVTGTTAVEFFPDGREIPTTRWGAASVSEMPEALVRAKVNAAEVGIVECMAVTPELIRLVQVAHVKSEIVVIPTIRLDHLEEEGLTEQEIAQSIVDSVPGCRHLVVGVEQPDVLRVIREHCDNNDVALTVAAPGPEQPYVPGHHPTNVAVALAVADLLGITAESAYQAIAEASLEPRSLTMFAVDCAPGWTVGLIDLGGANDPQSAFEAIESVGLPEGRVVPVLVNRWERPLRALVFISAVLGRFPRVGVSGTLAPWARFFHRAFPDHAGEPHRESEVVSVSHAMARNPQLLAERLVGSADIAPGERVTVMLLENTHEPVTDAIRKTFATQGREIPVAEWVLGA